MPEIVNVSPTLIIGLGGTGSLALQYIKRKVRKRLEAYKGTGGPLPKHIPFIEYLVLDTTAQEEMLEEFVPDEFLNIGQLNISRIMSHLEQESDYNVQKWFPRKLDPGQIDSGAGGVRAIGRLCFFINQSQIESMLRSKVGNITNSAKIMTFIKEHLPGLRYKEGSTIAVHIVSSLCGGTGSACLLDTSYLVKHVVAVDPKQMTDSCAHLVTTEPFEGEPGVGRSSREYIQQNFAVTLSEVEHFTQKDAPRPWNVEYRGGTRVLSDEKPFSLAYLMGCKEGVSLSKKHVCEIIGEAIAIKTVHPEGRRIKGIIENLKPHVINTEDVKQKRRTYSSYNTRILNTGVDKPLFESATRTAARTILSSLCEEYLSSEMIDKAFKDFEEKVFADKVKLSRITFGLFLAELNDKVGITSDMFIGACRNLRSVPSWRDKKRKNESSSLAGTVLVACQGLDDEVIRDKQECFLLLWERRVEELHKETDAKINELLRQHSLPYVKTLLENISERLHEFLIELSQHERSVSNPQRQFYEEIVKAIELGSINKVPSICADKSRAKSHGVIVNNVFAKLTEYNQGIDSRVEWCEAAQQLLVTTRKAFDEKKRVVPSSHTTSFVWTQDALEQVILEAKSGLVRKFIELLERRYFVNGGLNQQICFLPRLDRKFSEARRDVEQLVQQAAREALLVEIDGNKELKRQEALRGMHEFVELASPPWQIERLGEDIAAVSLTTCPEDSYSGEIMARSGKNIVFGSNGNNVSEYMLFRSEHGVSVNHLINFRLCLKAVYRKLQSEGLHRINDLCLDPEWNIASPLPIEEEMEELRLYFSLALRFQLLKQEMSAYTFTTPSGHTVLLRRNTDVTKAVKRFEAFEKLLDMDGDGSADCDYFKQMVEAEITERKKEEHIQGFKDELSAHCESLRQLMPKAKDLHKEPRDARQLEKEVKGIERLLEEIERYFEEKGQDNHGS
jgi:hypothetical protein